MGTMWFLCDPTTSASNWLERLPAGSISTWEDLTTRFLAQFFPPKRTAKLRNDILMFQQHQVQIVYDHIDHTLSRAVNYAAGGRLGETSTEKAWIIIGELAQYEEEGWNDPIFPEEGSPNYGNANIEQILEVMEI
ncbi:zinc finger, CCHC-type containing protein [Tanacetum coccineum]